MSKQFKSMAGLTGEYRIKLVDQEPIEVRIIGADMMRWEQSEKGRSFFEGDTIPLSRLAFAAWAALRRTNKTELVFAEFMKSVEDIETEKTDDESDEDEDVEDVDDGVVLPDPTDGDTTAW